MQTNGAVAQMVERFVSIEEVLGSMPSCSNIFVAIAQLGERKTEDLEVIGSIPIGDMFIWYYKRRLHTAKIKIKINNI